MSDNKINDLLKQNNIRSPDSPSVSGETTETSSSSNDSSNNTVRNNNRRNNNRRNNNRRNNNRRNTKSEIAAREPEAPERAVAAPERAVAAPERAPAKAEEPETPAKAEEPETPAKAVEPSPPVAESIKKEFKDKVASTLNALKSNSTSIGSSVTGLLGQNDAVSKLIKVCVLIIILLSLVLFYNLSLKMSGDARNVVFMLVAAVLSFVVSELGIPAIISDESNLKYIGVFFFGLGTLFLVLTLKNGINYIKNLKISSPMILPASKSARKAMVIPQNNSKDAIILHRSHDEDEGIEFSYQFWMVIENYEYKNNEWKHILHKGNQEGTPNMCPGFWLHPNKNTMRVYVNTMKDMKEHFDVEDIPLKKWVCVAFTQKQDVCELYINGILKKRHTLSSIPRQNFGPLWLNLYGGYDGFISNVQYFREAIDHNQVLALLNKGPSSSACIDSGELPPYLDDNWWLNDE
jgi:hypothetical protein